MELIQLTIIEMYRLCSDEGAASQFGEVQASTRSKPLDNGFYLSLAEAPLLAGGKFTVSNHLPSSRLLKFLGTPDKVIHQTVNRPFTVSGFFFKVKYENKGKEDTPITVINPHILAAFCSLRATIVMVKTWQKSSLISLSKGNQSQIYSLHIDDILTLNPK